MSIKAKIILLNVLTLMTLISIVCMIFAGNLPYNSETNLHKIVDIFARGGIFMVMITITLAVVMRDKAKKELNNQQNLILHKTATRTFYIFGTIAVLAVIYWIFFMIHAFIGIGRIEW